MPVERVLVCTVGGANNARVVSRLHSTADVTLRADEFRAACGSAPSGFERPHLQFTLRQLLCLFAAASALLACLRTVGGLTALAIILAVAVVAAHLAGAALGRRLRMKEFRGRRPHSDVDIDPGFSSPAADADNPSSSHLLRRSPWHQRGGTAVPWLMRLVLVAMLGGGLLGWVGLEFAIGHRASIAGIAVGATSFAVISGWIAFVAANFYAIFRHGWRDALSEHIPKPHNAGMTDVSL